MVNITALGAMILLSCKGMFDGQVPDSTIITAFQKEVLETNETEIVKQTVIGSTSTNVSVFTGDLMAFRIQYTKENGKDVFGGHVMNKDKQYCPLNGEDDLMNIVGEITCDDSPFYLIGNQLVRINKQPNQESVIYNLDGAKINAQKFIAHVDCTRKPCGFDAEEKVVVDHEGNCFAFGNTGDWVPQKCAATKIKVEPGETTHPFHLRYLSIVHKCQMKPALKESELDNTYISFVRNPRPNVTDKPKKPNEDVMPAIEWIGISGAACVLGLLIVLGATICWCVIRIKQVKKPKSLEKIHDKAFLQDIKNNFNKTLEEPMENKEKTAPVDYELDDLHIDEVVEKTFIHDEDLDVKIPKKLHKTNRQKPIEAPVHVTGLEKYKLKPRVQRPLPKFEGPRKKPYKVLAKSNWRALAGKSEKAGKTEGKSKMKPVAQANEVKDKVKDMKKIDEKKDKVEGNRDDGGQNKEKELNRRPERKVVYEMVGRLEKGSFGVIYRYEMEKNQYAVKFFKTKDKKSMARARKIYGTFKSIAYKRKLAWRDLLVDYVGLGQTPQTTYLIMPWYGNSMEKKKTDGMTLSQKFNLIYHYFLPIKQLQVLKIAHLSIKPKNYLRKLGTNELILTEISHARRFGTKRKQVIGTPAYMSATTHHCRPVSIMDDLQSWFIMCFEVLEPPLVWKHVVVRDDPFYGQMLALKQRFLRMLGGNGDSAIFLVELKQEIWDKDFDDDPDVRRIAKIMEDFQSLYKFKFYEPWE